MRTHDNSGSIAPAIVVIEPSIIDAQLTITDRNTGPSTSVDVPAWFNSGASSAHFTVRNVAGSRKSEKWYDPSGPENR